MVKDASSPDHFPQPPWEPDSLGLQPQDVRVVEHDSTWVLLFKAEKIYLKHLMGDLALAIEHVGSTAVSKLPAKPIIDIAVAVASLDKHLLPIELLDEAGYQHKPEMIIDGEVFFRKSSGCFHLHLLKFGSAPWENYLLFRDYLRSRPAVAVAYRNLKLSLAHKFPHDRPAYTQGKAEFITAILKRARAASNLSNP